MAEGFWWEQNCVVKKGNDRRDDATSGKNDTVRNYAVALERIDMEIGRWCIWRTGLSRRRLRDVVVADFFYRKDARAQGRMQ
jgi:hypothetical protein